MNADFVRKHLKVGKARMRPNLQYPKQVWYGVPKAHFFVRAYSKPQIGFRVEVQFNRPDLVRHGIVGAADIARLANVVVRRIKFHRVDWMRLEAHLSTLRSPYAQELVKRARAYGDNLTVLLHFLRQVSVTNPDRFLIPLDMNATIADAVRRWRRRWNRNKAQGGMRRMRTRGWQAR